MADSPYSGKDPQAYIKAVEALVGERDPIEVMDRLVIALSRFLADKSVGKLNLPEAEGKWSISDVVYHLLDAELIYGYRLRMVLASDAPQFLNVDQDLWAGRHWYQGLGLDDALRSLEWLRKANLSIVRALSDKQLARTGTHSSRGTETVSQMIIRWAGHDLLHYNQIERIWNTVD